MVSKFCQCFVLKMPRNALFCSFFSKLTKWFCWKMHFEKQFCRENATFQKWRCHGILDRLYFSIRSIEATPCPYVCRGRESNKLATITALVNCGHGSAWAPLYNTDCTECWLGQAKPHQENKRTSSSTFLRAFGAWAKALQRQKHTCKPKEK